VLSFDLILNQKYSIGNRGPLNLLVRMFNYNYESFSDVTFDPFVIVYRKHY